MSKAGKETEDTTALAVASTCRGVFESIIDTIGAADSYSVAGQKVCVPAGGISPAEVFSAMAAAPSKISTPPTSGVSAPTYIRGVIQALYVCK